MNYLPRRSTPLPLQDCCMNFRVDDDQLATLKFAVGQPVLRNEDPTLVRGEGT